jgi:uncharacterized oligopeptide transporter (OPT) family protein
MAPRLASGKDRGPMATPSEKIARPTTTPAPRRELTFRAVVVSVMVAAIMGASFPYVVLKIGYGPNISVVAAFFGFMLLAVVGAISRRPSTVYEANMAQTAGTAAGEIGFMCIVLAALDMLNARSGLGFSLHLSALQIFLWLTCAGLLGAFLAVPLRRHYIDEENLVFADGTAAGETLVVLYQGPREAARRLKALFGGGGLSALLALAHEPLRVLPEVATFGAHGAALRMGAELGVLSIGAGMLVGLRVTLSMGLGMVLSWILAPPLLAGQGFVHEQTFPAVLKWVMWPATGLMVAGGVTALVLNWKVMARTFAGLSAKDVGSDEFPLRWMLWGAGLSAVALALVQKLSLGFPIWLTAVSILLSIPLMLVGIRVLGETNWAPISTLANFMQAVFAALQPGHIPVNMIGSGMSGTVAGQGEHLMQCYRSGKIIGSNNRSLMWTQLIGIPVGAAALAIVYPALRDKYGFEGAHALTSPISVKWAGFAELLSKGFSTLPPGSLTALAVALVLGVVITVLEPRWGRFLPSTTAVGIGMVIPGTATLSMVIGGVAWWLWSKKSPRSEAVYNMPLASGFIAGEAMVVLVIAVIAAARSFAG